MIQSMQAQQMRCPVSSYVLQLSKTNERVVELRNWCSELAQLIMCTEGSEREGVVDGLMVGSDPGKLLDKLAQSRDGRSSAGREAARLQLASDE